MTVIGLQLTRLWLRKYISGFIQSNSATQLFNSSWLFYLEGTYKKYKKLALIPAFGRFLPLIRWHFSGNISVFIIRFFLFFQLKQMFSRCVTPLFWLLKEIIYLNLLIQGILYRWLDTQMKNDMCQRIDGSHIQCAVVVRLKWIFFFFVLTGFIYFDLVNWCVWNKRKTNQL